MTITGTHRGEFAGIPPQGNPIKFELAAVYIFDTEEPGKLGAERANDAIFRQMKSEAEALSVA